MNWIERIEKVFKIFTFLTIIRKYNDSRKTFSEIESKEDREFLNTFSFICMLSFDVYMKKQMIEKLIDESILDKNKKKTKE